MTSNREHVTVIPQQDPVKLLVEGGTVTLTQESVTEGDSSITINGRENLGRMISALQHVREQWQ